MQELNRRARSLLLPGQGLKRWLGVAFVGLFQVALGASFWVNGLVRRLQQALFDKPGQRSEAPAFPLGLLFIGSGVLTTYVGWSRLGRSLMRVLMPERAEGEFTQVVMERQREARGRRVVVIGGEPGLSPLLHALRLTGEDIRLDVIVASTEGGPRIQELRRRFGLSGEQIIYPTEADSVLYAEMDDGIMLEGATAINRHGGGQIKDLFLSRDIRRVQVWESENSGVGDKARLRGYMPNVSESALEVLDTAEMILFAPGRIYTQVLPNLTQPRFAQAVRESKATKVFVANLMTEPGRTDGWTVADHLAVIRQTSGVQMDYAIVHAGGVSEPMLSQYRNEGAAPVSLRSDDELSRLIFADTGEQTTLMKDAIILREDVVTEAPQIVTFQRNGDTILREMPVVRHDPAKLAAVLKRLLSRDV